MGVAEDTRCITAFEEYKSMTCNVVLTNVSPLLKGRDGKKYKKRADQSENG